MPKPNFQLVHVVVRALHGVGTENVILPGDVLTVDPQREPKAGDYIVRGERIEHPPIPITGPDFRGWW